MLHRDFLLLIVNQVSISSCHPKKFIFEVHLLFLMSRIMPVIISLQDDKHFLQAFLKYMQATGFLMIFVSNYDVGHV